MYNQYPPPQPTRVKWRVNAINEGRLERLPGLPLDEKSPEFYNACRHYRQHALDILYRLRVHLGVPIELRFGGFKHALNYICEIADEILECDPPVECKHIALRMKTVALHHKMRSEYHQRAWGMYMVRNECGYLLSDLGKKAQSEVAELKQRAYPNGIPADRDVTKGYRMGMEIPPHRYPIRVKVTRFGESDDRYRVIESFETVLYHNGMLDIPEENQIADHPTPRHLLSFPTMYESVTAVNGVSTDGRDSTSFERRIANRAYRTSLRERSK